MVRGKVLGRAALVTLAAVGAQASCAVALRTSLGVRAGAIEAALLLMAVQALGAAWALRGLASSGGAIASRAAAWVPAAALLCVTAPRLAFESATSGWALLTVGFGAVGAVAAAWRTWVSPVAEDERANDVAPDRAAFVAAPLLAVAAFAASASAPHAAVLGSVAALTLGGIAYVRVAKQNARLAASRAFVAAVEIDPDEMRVPKAHASVSPALVRDIEERSRAFASHVAADAAARRQIAEARALRTRFMAVMSHELRSPLNSIVGFASLLERGLEGELTEGQRESATMIRRAADELILLLTDVLDLARLEAGRLKLVRQWTPSVEILTEAVTRGNTLVEGRDVEIVGELQPGLPPVEVDARRIRQAILALFRSSARELRGATVHVSARVAQGPPGPEYQLRVEIRDALDALPAGDLERLFEAFQEISAPTGRRLGGLGMALTLSRGLVRLHGGDVWVNTESADHGGTTLCLALPLEDA